MSSFGGSSNAKPQGKNKGFLKAILNQTKDKKLLEMVNQPLPDLEPEIENLEPVLVIISAPKVKPEPEPVVNFEIPEIREISEKNRLEPGLSVFALQVGNSSPVRNCDEISKPQKNIEYDLYNNEDSEARVQGHIGSTPGMPANPKEEFGSTQKKNNCDAKDRAGRFASFHTGQTPENLETSPVRQPKAAIFGG